MAVNNTLVKSNPNERLVTFQAGDQEIKLSPEMVKKYLVSGDSSKVTDQEVMMFIMMCKGNHLNPWNNEAYCIKYGNAPAKMITGKTAFFKRADSNPAYNGMKDGIVTYKESNDEIKHRKGAIVPPGEVLIGAWAEVFRKDRDESTYVEADFKEFAQKNNEGKLNSQWAKMPATMILKVAQVNALREAFPSSLGDLYTSDEMGVDEPTAQFIEQNVDIKVEHNKQQTVANAPDNDESLF